MTDLATGTDVEPLLESADASRKLLLQTLSKKIPSVVLEGRVTRLIYQVSFQKVASLVSSESVAVWLPIPVT